MCSLVSTIRFTTLLDDAETSSRESPKLLLDSLLTHNTKDQKTKRKVISLAQSIISTIQPRSLIFFVLQRMSFFIHRQCGSRNLLDRLSNFGCSGSYYDGNQLTPEMWGWTREVGGNLESITRLDIHVPGVFSVSVTAAQDQVTFIY